MLASASPQSGRQSRWYFFLVGAPGFELRLPSAILGRLGGRMLDRMRGPQLPASAEPTVLASAFGNPRSSRRQSPDRNADHSFPPRLNLRFWRPPSAVAACSLARARKSVRQIHWYFILVGAPGFEPGTSASRTQRSTELSHAPKSYFTARRTFPRKRVGDVADHISPPRLEPTASTDGVGFEPTRTCVQRLSRASP